MKWTITRKCSGIATHIAVVITMLLLGACGGPDVGPEEQLRQWVSAAEAAAETEERRAMLDLISPAYVGEVGWDRADVGNMLSVYFLRQHSIELLTSIEEIRLYGDSAAEIDMTVGMAGTNDGAFGFSADAYNLQLELQRDGDDWLLIASRWGELGEELH
jgi:hypothetical protein